MRLVAAIALGVFALGALITWATDWTIGGADGAVIGAILMIAAGVVLISLLLLSASRSGPGELGAHDGEAIDEPDDRMSAGWPQR